MNKPELKFTNYDDWAYECLNRNLDGPHKIQGYNSFEFKQGTAVAALWNGQDDQGVVYGGEFDPPHASPPVLTDEVDDG